MAGLEYSQEQGGDGFCQAGLELAMACQGSPGQSLLCPPCPHSLRGRVVELILSSTVKTRLNPPILPQLLDAGDQLGGHRALLDGVCQVEEQPAFILQEGPLSPTPPVALVPPKCPQDLGDNMGLLWTWVPGAALAPHHGVWGAGTAPRLTAQEDSA